MTQDAVSGLSGPDNSDPWDGDAPVFDPKCEKCGRFHKRSEIRMMVNGAGEILSATSVCPKCGVVPVHVTHWRSDEEYTYPKRDGVPLERDA